MNIVCDLEDDMFIVVSATRRQVEPCEENILVNEMELNPNNATPEIEDSMPSLHWKLNGMTNV